MNQSEYPRKASGRGERGMTVVELIVAMCIGAILLTLTFQFFNTQTNNFLQGRQNSEMQQELRWGLQFISYYVKLSGNGVPSVSLDDTGHRIIQNVNGAGNAPDSLLIIGSFRSLVVSLDQTMASTSAQIKCSDKANSPAKPLSNLFEIGDLGVISDGTSTEVFMMTNIQNDLISHATLAPWNTSNNLDRTYNVGSTIIPATEYCFFIATDASGHPNLMVRTQSYAPEILAGDVDGFQVRFLMKSGDYKNEIDANEIEDVRQIEITLRGRTPQPIAGYTDPAYHDHYKRLELKTLIIPKNLVKNI
jgi:hypothetical protein